MMNEQKLREDAQMKVIDLYKQLEILLQSGQEDLQVMISTSADYVPLEVVEIEDDKCWLCDSWTPVYESEVCGDD